jgi:hypothetical protein
MKNLALIAAILWSSYAVGNGTITVLDRYGRPAYYVNQNERFTTIIDGYGRPVGYGVDSSPAPIDPRPITIPGRNNTMPGQMDLYDQGLTDLDGRF